MNQVSRRTPHPQLLAWLLLLIATTATALSAQDYALSPISLQEARDRVAELRQQPQPAAEALPKLPPKEMFETTADYEKRTLPITDRNQQVLDQFDSRIEALTRAYYAVPDLKPALVSYDADRLELTFSLTAAPTPVALTFGTLAEAAQARAMHDDWLKVGLMSSYYDADEPPEPSLIWQGHLMLGFSNSLPPPGQAAGGAVVSPEALTASVTA